MGNRGGTEHVIEWLGLRVDLEVEEEGRGNIER